MNGEAAAAAAVMQLARQLTRSTCHALILTGLSPCLSWQPDDATASYWCGQVSC